MNAGTKIFTRFCRICLVGVLILGIFGFLSCENKPTKATDDNNDDMECPPWTIGPEGGVLEDTIPESPYYGVKVIIPEGALEYCTSLYFNEYFTWPFGYAGGFTPLNYKPFNFNLGNFMDGDSVHIRLSLPLKNIAISDSTSQILCAFHSDPSIPCYLKWKIALPAEINDSTMIIDSDCYYGSWAYGLVSLYEVDYECYLKPLMGDIVGEEKWSEIVSDMQTVIDTTILADDFDFGCVSLFITRSIFEGLYLALGDQMEMYQTVISPIAGDCNVLNPIEFFEGAIQYIGINSLAMMVSLVDGIGPGGLLSSFLAKMAESAAGSTACDYAAFMQWTDEQFWGYFSLYCFYYMMIQLIDWFVMDSGVMNCPTWTPTTIVWE
jgi:hypothetical protein